MTQVPINLLGDYSILRELSPAHTYLALSPRGDKVVLKKLDDDCLFESRLHVSIKERLERIQQIPHAAVANLHGVERVGGEEGAAYLVWDYLEGTPLEEFLTTADHRGRLPDLTAVGRELVMAVEGLARLGIVHGSLHGRNIIVSPPSGQIRLTHLSPYLYTDPAEDARAVIDLLLDSLNQRYQPGDLPVHRLLTRAQEDHYDLARLGPLLACPPDSPLSPMQTSPRSPRVRGRRRRSVLLAVAALLAGLAISAAALHLAGLLPALPLPHEIPRLPAWLRSHLPSRL